jgi:Flp pilus assembly pilin Flp
MKKIGGSTMLQQLYTFWRGEEGQDLIEYSLLITFIAIACLWFIGTGGPSIRGVWTSANSTTSQASVAAGS